MAIANPRNYLRNGWEVYSNPKEFLQITRSVFGHRFDQNFSRSVVGGVRTYDRCDVPDEEDPDFRWIPKAKTKLGQDNIENRRSEDLQAIIEQLSRLYDSYHSFVERAQRLAELGKIDAALDVIYDNADEMMLKGAFAELNEIIASLDPKALCLDVILGILTISSPARSKLPARAKFYCDAKQVLHDRGECRKGLLTGLE